MDIPRKIYDTVSKTTILNVFKYFKDESLKFPPNQPQKSYLKKTAEVTGLHHRTISWICQSAKTSTASSSAAQMPVPTTPALPATSNAAQSATQKENSRAIILDDFDKCVIRRTIQEFYYALIEKDRIVNMRAAYLRKMKTYR